MNKYDFMQLLDNLNIKYEEKEYHLGQSGLQLENATSYLELERCDNCVLHYAGIYIYFDNYDNFILIEGSE